MPTVLIVDDSLLLRMNIANIVKSGGYDILEASDGASALQMLTETTPNCVCLDLLMPDMDGYDVLEAMGGRAKEIPIIVLTADIQTSTRDKCLALGAARILNKPPKKEQLLETIKELISQKES
ncbi:response regulator receiver protein [Candidatus Magnetobacterium bavaricum]|uniref:Response regulator receiver protein n=1 Tax=Candidatus Magnetobacterium bavaricum TaxID=29290 RepID=A0A0F3GVN9_9BACT|nr:response regulator receiver protein [Candidatus Magnetobacterium bavaricum]